MATHSSGWVLVAMSLPDLPGSWTTTTTSFFSPDWVPMPLMPLTHRKIMEWLVEACPCQIHVRPCHGVPVDKLYRHPQQDSSKNLSQDFMNWWSQPQGSKFQPFCLGFYKMAPIFVHMHLEPSNLARMQPSIDPPKVPWEAERREAPFARHESPWREIDEFHPIAWGKK